MRSWESRYEPCARGRCSLALPFWRDSSHLSPHICPLSIRLHTRYRLHAQMFLAHIEMIRTGLTTFPERSQELQHWSYQRAKQMATLLACTPTNLPFILYFSFHGYFKANLCLKFLKNRPLVASPEPLTQSPSITGMFSWCNKIFVILKCNWKKITCCVRIRGWRNSIC